MSPVAPNCSDVTITDVTILGEVEIKNDAGNPVPVTFTGDVEVDTDDLEDCCAETNALLTTINDSANTLEASTHLEDDPAASGDRGSFALGVRNDTAAVTTSTDGDYSQISTDSAGRVGVADLGGSLSVDDGGTPLDVNVVSGSATNTEYTEGDVDASITGQAILWEDTGDTLATVSAANPLPVLISDGAGPVTVDGTVSITNDPTKLEDAPAVSGDRGAYALGVRNDAAAVTTSTDGDYSQISTDSSGRVGVSDLGGSLSVDDNGGSLSVDDGGATLSIDDGGGSITVDGTLGVTNDPTHLEDDAFVGGDRGTLSLAVRNDAAAATTSTDGDYSQLSTDSAGRLGVTDLGGSLSVDDNGGSLTVDNADITASAASLSVIDDWDESDRAKVNPIAGQAGVQGASGVVTALTQRVVLATDVALPAGTNLIGQVSLAPQTSGGSSVYKNLDVDETGVNVKASAGQVYGYYVYNNATSTRYLKLYNKASAPTVGTDTPVMTIGIPASSAANVEFSNGIAFSLGIGVGAVTGVLDTSTGTPGANDVVLNLLYK